MNAEWRNRILYWVLAIIPLFACALAGRLLGPTFFALFLVFYYLTYRPLLDTRRLISLGKLEEKDAWRFFVPFAVDQSKYIRMLWLG